MDVQEAIFLHPFPLEWLLQDVVVLLLAVVTAGLVARREPRPLVVMLEAFAFLFLYASVYENAAGVRGLYTFGRSVVMFGYVPASIPLIEVIVLLTGLWLLAKTSVPSWTKPLIIGLFGMLQDFSLDPLAIRQIHQVGDVTSGRWNWLFDPGTSPDILGVPTFNFPGWMLIMLYSSTMLLLGRWVHRRSGYDRWVGVVYPFVSMLGALVLMVSPASQLLLWLGPLAERASVTEWVMLGVHLVVPTLLLVAYGRRGTPEPFTKDDLPLFAIPMVMHASDLLFTLAGGHLEILWLVLLSSAVHATLLAGIYAWNRAPARHAYPATT